jgi:hypothetical protein
MSLIYAIWEKIDEVDLHWIFSYEKAACQHLGDNAALVRAICSEGHRAHLFTLHKCIKLR